MADNSKLVTAAVATGVVVYAGRIADDKKIDVRIAVGSGVFAIGLTLLSNMDQKLATQFAWLVLIGALFLYLPPVVKKMGILTDSGRKKGT